MQNEIDDEMMIREYRRIRGKYPNRIPVICKPSNSSDPVLDKQKYIVPLDLTIGQFLYVIRKRLKLRPEEALFILYKEEFPSCSTEMGTLFDRTTEDFMYLTYKLENTFGGE